MDPTMTDIELVPEREKIGEAKEAGPAFHCDLYDKETVHKIAQMLLPGLASACVDNTTGLFRSAGSVAVDIRKEMIDYLTQRSESFVAESVILEGGPDTEVSDHPYDIISDFVDDFASSKRNFFSRVSGWLLSEKREDNIDDFVQEMEMSGFWLMDRREQIAQNLLKNVDFKNIFHCDQKFSAALELAEHVGSCGFRSMNCTNEGCRAIFSASQMDGHDSICPFKIIPCEQKCSDNIMRREMDRHCITVCPMKLVNCPLYAVGCQSSVHKCMINQHNADDLQSHLLYILKTLHKRASLDDLRLRVDQIMQSSSGQLAEATDVRSITNAVKNLEAKLGPLEVNAVKKFDRESTEAETNISEESTEAASVNKVGEESTEATNKIGEEATNKVGEKSTEVANNIIEESTEALKKLSDDLTKATDKIDEKCTESLDKVKERSTETTNLAVPALKEAEVQAQTQNS